MSICRHRQNRARRKSVGLLVSTIAGVTGLVFIGTATGARPIATGFLEAQYKSHDATTRAEVFAKTIDSNAEIIRVNLVWSRIAVTQPADPRDPADPAYDFDGVDAAVTDARANGLDVLITVYSAPSFAQGADPPDGVIPGTWKVDPNALADFYAAIATRYSGRFADLPRARYFEVWNEPNLPGFLTPQYEGGSAAAPSRYRRMVNASFKAIKGINPDIQVVAGGLAPYGDPPGGARTRPLAFWRDLLCLDRGLKAVKCPTKVKFDILSHHPINTSGGPNTSAAHPDDVSTPDFKNIAEVLRAAERANTVGTGGRHPLWATELWWNSDLSGTLPSFPLDAQARFYQNGLYVLWKQHVDVVIVLQLQDDPRSEFSTGLFFADGSPKPSFAAFRFPLVSDDDGSETRVWGKSPEAGKLAIQLRKGKGWRTLRKLNVDRGDVFSERVKLPAKYSIRATVSGATSLTWREG